MTRAKRSNSSKKREVTFHSSAVIHQVSASDRKEQICCVCGNYYEADIRPSDSKNGTENTPDRADSNNQQISVSVQNSIEKLMKDFQMFKNEICDQITQISDKISDLRLHQDKPTVTSTGQQTDNSQDAKMLQTKTTHATYADAVKQSAATDKGGDKKQKIPAKTTEKEQINKNQSKDENVNSRHDVKVNADVHKVHKTSLNTEVSGKGLEKERKNKDNKDHRQTKNDVSSDLPKVLMYHDSIMKRISDKRLGSSYGFDLSMTNTYTIEEVKLSLAKESPSTTQNAIIIHVGINDLKARSAEECSDDFVDMVNTTLNTHKAANVIVSRVAPCNLPSLKSKVDLFNAYNGSKLYSIKRVSFVSHENLKIDSQRILKDNIHPTDRGTSVLAGNIGRHVHHMFWMKVQSKLSGRQRRGWQQKRSSTGSFNNYVYQHHRNPDYHSFNRNFWLWSY